MSDERLPRNLGIGPVKLLILNLSCCKFLRNAKLLGIGPREKDKT